MTPQIIAAFEGDTSASKVSAKIYVGDYDKVGILIRRAAHTSGSGAFSVKGGFGLANADPTMTALNTLIDNVTNTNAQTLTRVNGKTLGANGDAFLWVSPETPVTHLEITVARTTDGTHSAYVIGFMDCD